MPLTDDVQLAFILPIPSAQIVTINNVCKISRSTLDHMFIQILPLPNVSISVNIISNLFIIHSPVQKYLTPQQKLIFSNTYKSKLFTPINKYSLCFSLVI